MVADTIINVEKRGGKQKAPASQRRHERREPSDNGDKRPARRNGGKHTGPNRTRGRAGVSAGVPTVAGAVGAGTEQQSYKGRLLRGLQVCENAGKARSYWHDQVDSDQGLSIERPCVRRGGSREWTPRYAQVGRCQRVAVGFRHACQGGTGRPPRRVPVGASQQMPMELVRVQRCGREWAPRCAQVAAGQRLSVGLAHVLHGGNGRPSGDTLVSQSQRVRLVFRHLHDGTRGKPSRGSPVGTRQRMSVGPADVQKQGRQRQARACGDVVGISGTTERG